MTATAREGHAYAAHRRAPRHGELSGMVVVAALPAKEPATLRQRDHAARVALDARYTISQGRRRRRQRWGSRRLHGHAARRGACRGGHPGSPRVHVAALG